MKNLLPYKLYENIAHAQTLIRALGLHYVRYVYSKSKRAGIKDIVNNVVFYKGIAVAYGRIMREFINQLMKFVRNKSRIDAYLTSSTNYIKSLFPSARIQYYPEKLTPDDLSADRNYNTERRIYYFSSNKSDIYLYKAFFKYQEYNCVLDVNINDLDVNKPTSVVQIHDDRYKYRSRFGNWYDPRETYPVGDLKNLIAVLDDVENKRIKEWTERIDRDFDEMHNCPEYLLKKILKPNIHKLKDIGVFDIEDE